MENQRLFLFLALALVIMLLWQAWQQTFGPHQPVSTTQAPQVTAPATTPSAPSTVPSEQPSAPAAQPPATPAPEAALASAQSIHVVTDLLDLEFDTVGGDLRKADLLAYSLSSKDKTPYPLMNDELPHLYVAQSGLLANAPAPDHHAHYSADKTEYRLQPGVDELKVPLHWTSPAGITVTKVYTFHRNSYIIDVEHVVENHSASEWRGRAYRQFQRTEYAEPGKTRFIYTFNGGVVSTPDKPYTKIKFSDMATWQPEQSFVKDGWAAMMQHYFVTAWIAGADEVNHYYTRAINNARYIIGSSTAEQGVAPGASTTFVSKLYVGPKESHRLAAAAKNLDLTVDYGWVTVIAKPIFWLMEKIHGVVGNWGWTIVLLTLTIKLAFFKLSEASYKSMANMRRMAPKMQALRERYGEDRQRMSQAMMELYKKEKANPLSGCWPILVQMPVFLALYWVLLESVELRQADFILWIHDLSTKDPFYVLPVLMGASMFLQQRLSPSPTMDPVHQKVMTFLPVFFTLFFAFFPAGLVLYWLVNNVLSISQQWYILHKFEKATPK